MIKLFLRQLFFIITTFFGITIITFYLHILALENNDNALNNATIIDAVVTNDIDPNLPIIKNKNLNLNLYKHYFQYINNVFKGDLGVSSFSRTAVTTDFLLHLPASIELVVLASILAVLVGLPLGITSAIHYRSPVDKLINNVALIAYSMPIFWWGIILIMLFSLKLGLTPVAGRLSFLFDIEPLTGFILIDTLLSNEPNHMDAFRNALMHLVLPVLVLATLPTAIIIRIARQTMLETLTKDYMLTAQAKGLSTFRIYWIHGFRNALIPFTNMLGLQISTLMTGAMLTEYLFAWPGIGKWIIDALQRNDYQSLQGGILITTALVILINAVIELLQAWLDPKISKKSRIYNG